MAKRQIVKIDQEKCDGCGLCVPSCAEGAIVIVAGKAQLLADKFCDGLGACLGECPRGALSIEERDTEEFAGPAPGASGEHGRQEAVKSTEAPAEKPFVCPGSAMRQFKPAAAPEAGTSALGHWPVKLRLVSAKAPFFKDAELLVAADCGPFAAGDFHARYLAGKAVVCGCPKFDDQEEAVVKLTGILRENDVKGITIVNMEVPCCSGLITAVRRALEASGKSLPVSICTLSAQGQVVQQAKIKAA
jgi:ferredoxin|uniref:4Fe-4S ferredoxin n=1 Tax=Desulfobacca acetoxidans TaxID=60893 RepID=A0A7V6A281_9BACT